MLSRVLVAGALLALTACTGGAEQASGGGPPDVATTPSAQLPPGLALGEPAEVAYAAPAGPTTLQVTVSAIERGDPADLGELEPPPGQAAGTPFYVQATIVNAGELDLSLEDPARRLAGLDDRGGYIPSVVIRTRFRPCDYVAAPEGFPPGDSFDTCVTYVVPDGEALAGVQWEGSPPVRWRG